MPAATGEIESCERICASLESEVDSVFEKFIDAAEGAEEFRAKMGRVDEQLALAAKMQGAAGDLELNETAVIVDKVELELSEAEELALGAALCDTEEYWAGEFEKAKSSLATLNSHMKKIKAASAEHDTLEARSALLSFRKHARACHMRLMKLKTMLASRRHHTHAKVEAARRRATALRAGVGRAFDKLAKIRLGKRIAEAKKEIVAFMKKTGNGKIFVDHKHLTFSADGRVQRVALTQALRFTLGEIAPIDEHLLRAGRGDCVVLGSYEKAGNSLVLKLGERKLDGDSIIYRERTYSILL